MDPNDRLASLEAELEAARRAVSEAEEAADGLRARLRLVEDELAASRAVQAEWDTLMGHIEAERAVARDVAAELEAVRASTTWRIGSAAMTPYRWVRDQQA